MGDTSVATREKSATHGTTTFWRRLFPMTPQAFLSRVTEPGAGVDRVVIEVSTRDRGAGPSYLISYTAYQAERSVLRARDEVRSADLQQALHTNEGDTPADLESAVPLAIQQLVDDSKARLREANIVVTGP